MTRPFLRALAPLTLAVAVVACGGSDPVSSPISPSPASPAPAPTPAPSGGSSCAASLAALPATVPMSGGSYPFAITVPSGCGWTARMDVTWAVVGPGSGPSSATSVLTIASNSARDPRTATLTVNGQAYRVVQDPFVCSYSVSPAKLDQNAGGGGVSVAMTASTGCAWTASASEGWIRVLTPSGTGSRTILLELAPNPGGERHASLRITGQAPIPVTQQGR